MDEKIQRLQNLVEFSQRRREWYQDLNIRIADRQSAHLSLVTSISAAILAITASLTPERNTWIDLSFWSLMVTVLLGTTLLLLLIYFDRKVATQDRKEELDTLESLKESTKIAIQKHPEYDELHRADFDAAIKRINELPIKYEGIQKWLNILYWLSLISFIIGIIGLAGAWLEKGGVLVNLNLVTLLIIIIGSIILGCIKFGSLNLSEDKSRNWQLNFAEIWNCSVNFLIAGLVGYYFVLYRWPAITNGQNITLTDFLLLLIFGMGMFGHINVLSKNITNGVEAILKRVLERK